MTRNAALPHDRIRLTDTLHAVAEHEASHGVVCHLLGIPVLRVEILPRGCQHAALCTMVPVAWRRGGLRSRYRADALVRLAGPVWDWRARRMERGCAQLLEAAEAVKKGGRR